jgi:signal transduction histidine kinase
VCKLVGNGLCYNQPSGRVDIAVSARSGHAILVVSNTGPLISACHIGRLFQAFQRLAPNRSGQRDGTGLGLSIVTTIADARDAAITATPGSTAG